MGKVKTPDEIVQQIKNLSLDGCVEDFFGFQRSDMMVHLPWDLAKQFLKEPIDPSHTAETWTQLPLTEEGLKKTMLEYMPFAWDKANNFRGLSAGRSINHYEAWIWMLGDEDVPAFQNLGDYQFYGKDKLVAICEHYGWDHKQWDDGVRKNSE